MKTDKFTITPSMTQNLEEITMALVKPGLFESIANFFSNTAAKPIECATELHVAAGYSTMTNAAQKQAIIDALNGNTFNNLITSYIENGGTDQLLRRISK